MQAAELFKHKSQAYVMPLWEKAKAQPQELKTWEITAGGALVGAVTMAKAGPGLLALLTLLAAPPVAVTVGALGGGWVGWRYLRTHPPLTAGVPPVATVPCSEMDDLERINGNTAVYANRLYAAGILTFAQLAELTPERVHFIIGPTYHSRVIHSQCWIAEAGRLAQSAKLRQPTL